MNGPTTTIKLLFVIWVLSVACFAVAASKGLLDQPTVTLGPEDGAN